MTLILGVYGAINLQLGSNCSLLITPNPLFVESIKVEQLDEANNEPILYGFYKEPPRDVVTTWSETQSTYIPAHLYKCELSELIFSNPYNCPSSEDRVSSGKCKGKTQKQYQRRHKMLSLLAKERNMHIPCFFLHQSFCGSL